MMEKRKLVNYVKGELEQYNFCMRTASVKLLKQESLEAQVNRVSGGLAKMPDGNAERNPHWRSPLYEEIEQLDKEIDAIMIRLNKVDEFLKRLSDEDREIIKRLHMSENDRRTYRDYCDEVYMSKRTLERHVNRIILNNWV